MLPLLIGYILDLMLGDPRWLPHPVRLFGKVIEQGEKYLNKGKGKLIKGALFSLTLCLLTYFIHFFIIEMLLHNIWSYNVFSSIMVFYGLANKSLLEEGQEVFDTLKNEGIEAGRKRLSWIVGRDTSLLSPKQIRIAVFETLSENLSDGVIAPLFYYALGGVPAMLTYKMINTLDSMIGYKSDRYIYFGKFAARLDDIANFIPSRLTALLIACVTFSLRSFQFIFLYGSKHASPNSGYPEAALAGALNCRFGGPNVYHGKIVNKPYIGSNDRNIVHEELFKVKIINHCVTAVMVIITLLSYFN